MANQHIPTPDEIREHLAGKSVLSTVAESRLDLMARQVNNISQSLSKLNRKSPKDLRDALLLLFEKHDFSPAEELVAMVLERGDDGDFKLTTDQRIRVLSDLNSYVMPKLKSMEVKGEVSHKHAIVIVRYGADGGVGEEHLKPQVERDAIPIKSEVTNE